MSKKKPPLAPSLTPPLKFFPYDVGLDLLFYGFFLAFMLVILWIFYKEGYDNFFSVFASVISGIIGLYFLHRLISCLWILLDRSLRKTLFGVTLNPSELTIRLSPWNSRTIPKKEILSCERKVYTVSRDVPGGAWEHVTLVHLKSGERVTLSDLKIKQGNLLKPAMDEWLKK